jgi:hypothetical protein
VTLSLAVVCEAPADRETACTLADRVVCEQIAWIDESLLPHLRQWRGRTPNELHLLWKEVPKLARERGLTLFGHFRGEPGAPDAFVARQALLLLKSSDCVPDGVLMIRDADDQPTRRRGLEQARDLKLLNAPVIIGFALTKRECWVLAGFEPCIPEEEERLKTLRQELGFHPCLNAEELTAKDDGSKRSAKRVLGILSGQDWGREVQCWRGADLGVLATRGRNTGLAEFLEEVRKELVPLFQHGS